MVEYVMTQNERGWFVVQLTRSETTCCSEVVGGPYKTEHKAKRRIRDLKVKDLAGK